MTILKCLGAWFGLTLMMFVLGQVFADFAFINFAHMDSKLVDSTTYIQFFKFIFIDGYSSTFTMKLIYIVSFIIFLSPTFIIIVFLIPKSEKLHGEARFATDLELKKSKLFDPQDSPYIVIGKREKGILKDKYCCVGGTNHVGVTAPTSGGKGVGIVLPNLVTFTDSLVVLDVKLENYRKTASYRKKALNNEIYIFAPDQAQSHCWNVFDYVDRKLEKRVGDILVIANSLYPKMGDSSDQWQGFAQNLFLALCLYCLDKEKSTGEVVSLVEINELGCHPDLTKFMKGEVAKQKLLEQGKASEDVFRLSRDTILQFNAFISIPPETQGSILTNFREPLTIFLDEDCKNATQSSSFDLREVRKKKITIYIGISPSNITKYKVLLNLFFEVLLSQNTKELPEDNPKLKYQCLLLLDEFAILGRVNQIKSAISYARGYNIRFLLVYQSEAQLEDKSLYDKEGARTIIDNLNVRVVYPTKLADSQAKLISETLGSKTVRVRNKSINSGKHASRSTAFQEQKRMLMMPHELIELGFEKYPDTTIGKNILILRDNQRPFKLVKLLSFADVSFSKAIEQSKEDFNKLKESGKLLI